MFFTKIIINTSIYINNQKIYNILIIEKINQYDLQDIVNIHGFLSDEEIEPFFDQCNIGVAYIPITAYYTDVVATKLYEYHLSGMVAIATETNENIKVVTSVNGVLIKDNSGSFADGLNRIYNNLSSWSSATIFEECKVKTMEYLVANEVVPAFNKMIEK